MTDNNESGFGTPSHKLHHSGGFDTSKEAAYKVDSAVWEERVYNVVESYGAHGCIQEQVLDDIHAKYGDDISYSTVTARFKALSENGLIFYPGEKRKQKSNRRSMVRVASKYREEWPVLLDKEPV